MTGNIELSKDAQIILDETRRNVAEFIKNIRIKDKQYTQTMASGLVIEGNLIYDKSISFIKHNKKAVFEYYQMQEEACWKFLEATEIDKIRLKSLEPSEKVNTNVAYLSDQEEILILRIA